MRVEVRGSGSASGTVVVPGDKSISHRAAILGALAHGTTEIEGYAPGLDCASTLECLRALGVEMEVREGGYVRIEGAGPGALREPEDVLNAGNSGTTMRLLAGVLAGRDFYSVITGDRSLRRRPMERVALPLREMGARISGRSGGKYAPLTIIGGGLRGITYRLPVASAQVKSAILLAGLFASGTTRVEEPAPSRDHTERMLRYFGADIRREGNLVSVTGGSNLSGRRVVVPGDISSAAFFLALGAMNPGSEVSISGVGLNPTRTGYLDALRRMGARISIENLREEGGEPLGDIRVFGGHLSGIELGPGEIPGLVDEIPIIAVIAARASGMTRITGAGELRVKESDRIRALALELAKMGVSVRELPDGLEIVGPGELTGAVVQSHGDHRIAMALAIAGLVARGTTVIEDAECANISFPGFWGLLARFGEVRLVTS